MTVRFNLAGLAGALADFDTASLHHTNPGVGADPAANTEITGAPYERQSIAFNAAVDVAGAATAVLSANVTWPLALSGNINANFIGLWKGEVYKGYLVPTNPQAFSGDATERSFTLEVENAEQTQQTVLTRYNEA
jgi:hypothetical protein